MSLTLVSPSFEGIPNEGLLISLVIILKHQKAQLQKTIEGLRARKQSKSVAVQTGCYEPIRDEFSPLLDEGVVNEANVLEETDLEEYDEDFHQVDSSKQSSANKFKSYLFLTAAEQVYEEDDYSVLDQNNNISDDILEESSEVNDCFLHKAETYGGLVDKEPESGSNSIWDLHLSSESDNSFPTAANNSSDGIKLQASRALPGPFGGEDRAAAFIKDSGSDSVKDLLLDTGGAPYSSHVGGVADIFKLCKSGQDEASAIWGDSSGGAPNFGGCRTNKIVYPANSTSAKLE